MMQPPPRKGNYAKFLKNLHSEQISKLVAKNQHECDLLEDIRTFTIKRCAIERSYSEALLKISSAYLNKKIPNIPDIKVDGGEEKWNMWNVWRTVLEENEKLSRARLAAVEVFQQQIAEDAKLLRSHKTNIAKKCVDHIAVVQKELQICVQDVDKTKKLYFDEEHSAHDVRDKARDLEEKLKKKKGSFFQSITSLQKNSAKFSSKRDQLEEKSSGARNDYLLCLAAANAHQNRYFVVDLQLAMSSMESSVFDKVCEYLTLMGRTELLTCSAMQNSFSVIRDQAKQLTREYNLQCCYLYYPVLKQHIQYEFEPCDNDPLDHITADHDSAAATLSKEARRWATKIARENNCVRESVRKLQIYNALRESGQKVDPNDQNGPDLETKIDEMKQSIRRAETAKMKAEARIEYLRIGGVNVDEWLQEAETLNVQDIQRSASSLSDHPSSDSFYDSDFADGEPTVTVAPVDVKVEKDYDEIDEDSQEVDAMLEQERHKIEQLTAEWDDPTQVNWGAADSEQTDGLVETSTSGPVLKCTALYSYTAQNPDELTIVENEQLEVVGEGDGDGWLRARNYRGEEGYVPHNYLDVEREEQTTPSTGGLVNQISFSSVDYTIDNEDGLQHSDANQSPDQVSVIAAPIPSNTIINEAADSELSFTMTKEHSESNSISAEPDTNIISKESYCAALYDYDGEGTEELSFEEGQVIRILSKCAHSIDDGWWQGEVEGRIGNFPSLVVEECDQWGEPLSEGSDAIPPGSAPPVFTPPDVPEHLITSTELFFDSPVENDDIISPPSGKPPCIPPPNLSEEDVQSIVAPPPPPPSSNHVVAASGGFNIELSQGQQEQYGQQFGGEGGVPTIAIPSVVVDDDHAQDCNENEDEDDEFALGVAQIVITAATPMIEEPEQPFPQSDDSPSSRTTDEQFGGDDELPPVLEEQEEDEDDMNICDTKLSKNILAQTHSDDDDDDEEEEHIAGQAADSAPFPISSSSEGETTGPSTAENSVSHAPPSTTVPDVSGKGEDIPKQVIGGRASIPDELEPHQLARLQDLKESNA